MKAPVRNIREWLSYRYDNKAENFFIKILWSISSNSDIIDKTFHWINNSRFSFFSQTLWFQEVIDHVFYFCFPPINCRYYKMDGHIDSNILGKQSILPMLWPIILTKYTIIQIKTAFSGTNISYFLVIDQLGTKTRKSLVCWQK